jgi:TRAP transporter TAXI family solute receptor
MREFFTDHKKLCISAAIIFLAFIACWLLSRYISPTPPKSFSFTAGASDGAYYKYAMRYKTILAKDGITLDVRESKGSVENIQRLEDKKSNVLAGFVQGGLGVISQSHDPDAENFDALQALGSVAFEPVWIFTKNPAITDLAQLKGQRIAIGAEGSGSRKVALDLLVASGLNASTELWLPMNANTAITALQNKQIDAIIAVVSLESESVQALLKLPGIHIVNLTHAGALARLFPYLQTISIPRGVLNLKADIPAKDITLLSTSANLVVSDNLHPALAYLLLDAAAQVHASGGALNSPGDFPHMKGSDYPVADEAKRYFTSGKPFLQRYMPFWMANFVQRWLLILIPLIAIIVPVVKLFPELQKFQQERKLFKLYAQLNLIEMDLKASTATETLSARIEALTATIHKTKFANVFADRVYTLREHVAFVQEIATKTPEML